jgi:hypothetical protein
VWPHHHASSIRSASFGLRTAAAIGLKVNDEFTVPLCRGHHRQLHQTSNEVAWWEDLQINAFEIARGLWEQTHPVPAITSNLHADGEATKN